MNVESGVNEGIATPVVMVGLAVAASQSLPDGESVSLEISHALRELGVGVIVGAVLGASGRWSSTGHRQQGWIAPGAVASPPSRWLGARWR